MKFLHQLVVVLLISAVTGVFAGAAVAQTHVASISTSSQTYVAGDVVYVTWSGGTKSDQVIVGCFDSTGHLDYALDVGALGGSGSLNFQTKVTGHTEWCQATLQSTPAPRTLSQTTFTVNV